MGGREGVVWVGERRYGHEGGSVGGRADVWAGGRRCVCIFSLFSEADSVRSCRDVTGA